MVAPVTDVPNRNSPIVDPDSGLSTVLMFAWMQFITDLLRQGYTGTVTTAALTGGGAQGSMTFVNGVLVSQVQAT